MELNNESRLNSAIASLAMEGFIATEEDKELARKCMRHEITYEEAVRELVKEYTMVSYEV